MTRTFTAYVEYDSETSLYIGTVPGLHGGHTQAASLDELRRNLQEVIELILDESESQGKHVVVEQFVGIQQITVER